MIQLNRIQLTSQTSNQLKMTKILKAPASVKVELLTASACLKICFFRDK